MSKFHVNPETGEPGICRAKVKCKFGGDSEHFTSEEAARSSFENKNTSFALKPFKIETVSIEEEGRLNNWVHSLTFDALGFSHENTPGVFPHDRITINSESDLNLIIVEIDGVAHINLDYGFHEGTLHEYKPITTELDPEKLFYRATDNDEFNEQYTYWEDEVTDKLRHSEDLIAKEFTEISKFFKNRYRVK